MILWHLTAWGLGWIGTLLATPPAVVGVYEPLIVVVLWRVYHAEQLARYFD